MLVSVCSVVGLLLRPLHQLHPPRQQPRSATIVACDSVFRALPPAAQRDVAAELYAGAPLACHPCMVRDALPAPRIASFATGCPIPRATHASLHPRELLVHITHLWLAATSTANSEIAADAAPPTPTRPLVALTVDEDGGLTLVGECVQNITSGPPPPPHRTPPPPRRHA